MRSSLISLFKQTAAFTKIAIFLGIAICTLIIIGILVKHEARPVKMDVVLGSNAKFTTDFKTYLSDKSYDIVLRTKVGVFDYDQLRCLLGVEDPSLMRLGLQDKCVYAPIINVKWSVTGNAIGNAKHVSKNRGIGDSNSQGVDRYIGRVNIERGERYTLSFTSLSDASVLNVSDPQIMLRMLPASESGLFAAAILIYWIMHLVVAVLFFLLVIAGLQKIMRSK